MSDLRLKSIGAVTYEDDDGQLRRRYWRGDELIDEPVPEDTETAQGRWS